MRTLSTHTNTPGTDTITFITLDAIEQIPRDRAVTYPRVVVDYYSQQDDPNHVRITASGNLINDPDKLTTRTANSTPIKVLGNIVLSTANT